MIAIIDYKAGNLASVSNAMDRLKAAYRITNKISVLEDADAVIFPGVGHAGSAMRDLQANGLDTWLRQTRKPVLGICLGMQLLYEDTTEGPTRTLGIVPGRLKRFLPEKGKVPHMGWNTVLPAGTDPAVEAPPPSGDPSPDLGQTHPLFNNITPGTHFYHVHSYYAPVTGHTIAQSRYSEPFTAAVAFNNFMGVQFHPEKSGIPGQQVLQNFVDLVYGRQPMNGG
ncbi:imidazole glycerol phosphate synthase subunit HisH [Balneolales bacterium ANBcel1]|nr:imidazole glycerol phosphate synthase subunit HisH [Balneolales bacterium ANBcel1]